MLPLLLLLLLLKLLMLKLSTGPSRFLDAITVTLNQVCDGKQWLASTKELQLASLQFCAACREMPTLHLRVDRSTPERLLTAPAEDTAVDLEAAVVAGGAGKTANRVPRLRARAVTWDLPTAERLGSPIDALASVEVIKFAGGFNGSVRSVAWPDKVMFGLSAAASLVWSWRTRACS